MTKTQKKRETKRRDPKAAKKKAKKNGESPINIRVYCEKSADATQSTEWSKPGSTNLEQVTRTPGHEEKTYRKRGRGAPLEQRRGGSEH